MIVLLLSCVDAPISTDPTTPAVDRSVEPSVWWLETTDPEAARDDLGVLQLEDATLVGLGESIHTSAGFYRAKHRLIRALVEDHGFRVIGFETPWWRAQEVGDWVAQCADGTQTGGPRSVMDTLFPVWWDTEVRDLLRWTCDYNSAHPEDPVAFIGWDIQQGPEDIALLATYFGETVDTAGLLQTCAGAGFASTDAFRSSPRWLDYQSGTVPTEDHERCVAGLDALDAELDARPPSDAVDRARLSTVGLRAFEGQTWFWPDPPASFSARDAGDAVVLPELLRLDHEGKKAVVWAHNAHLQTGLSSTCGYYCGAKGLGEWLREDFGAEYLAVGLVAWEVDIDWPGVNPPASPIDERGTLERALHRLEHPILWVDPTHPESRFAGEFEVGTSRLTVQVDAQFDRVLFLESSDAMEWILP